MLAGNKQPGSWSRFACHSHETIGDAFLPRQQSTGSAQRRGSPLTVGLPSWPLSPRSQRLAIVCLEREESMRKSWMQVLDAGSALYV